MDTPNRMITALHDGDLEKAMKEFKKIKVTGTDDEKFDLAEALFELGFLNEAKELYEQLMEAYPDEGELQVLFAETLVELDEAEEALLILEKVEASNEFYARALLLTADVYQMQGLYEVSERKLKEANKRQPGEPVLQFALAEVYNEQGKFLEAIRQYEAVHKAGEKEIGGVVIAQRLGECHSAGGAFEDALSYYQEALETKREINTLFGYAFTAYQAAHYVTAIEGFNELIELDDEYHSAYVMLARAYEHEEQVKEAYEAARNGIKADPYNKELFLLAGKLALKQGNEEGAEEALRSAIALDPNYLEAALVLNRVLIRQERADDVLELIRIVEEAGETDPQFHWDAAKAHEWLEQFDEASDEYEKAYLVYNDHVDFLADYGAFLIEEGQNEKALSVFEQLVQKDPSNEEWLSQTERLQDMQRYE